MAEQGKQFKCNGECINCPRVQREYCAAQKGYDNQRLLLALQESLKAMSGTIEEMRTKIEAIQDNEALIFDPNNTTEDNITQEGDGVIE